MAKIKIPFISPRAFAHTARELIDYLKPSTHKVGAPPGTLTYTGKHHIPTTVKLHVYNKGNSEAHELTSVEEIDRHLPSHHMHWIEVVGFENIEMIGKLGERFEISTLTLEDMLNVGQLPKIEELEKYVYTTLKIVEFKAEEEKFSISHFSMITKDNIMITFSETSHTLFDEITKRLQNPTSKLRSSDISYLSYRLIDTIVDHYYYAMEWFSNTFGELEIDLVEAPGKEHINTILTFKKQWLVLRKSIYPLRDAIRKGMNTEHRFVRSIGKQFIGDIFDHLQSIFETMEILRETLNNLMDLYNSTVSNRMNEVMQVLTIVSTIFIPLTFIAGIYGMNFQHMPELTWENGYFYVLILMLIIGIGMIIFMKRKRWF
jgi:magnesium transporter